MVIFFMSTLNVFRHVYFVIQSWLGSNEENPKYRLSNKSLWLLAFSIAYLLVAIFSGIRI